MTPISFALEILLDCETIEKAHKACRKYIKELERGQPAPQARALVSAPQITQAASTQRLMDAQIQTAAPLVAPVSSRIVGGEVGTGNGTRGPRKF